MWDHQDELSKAKVDKNTDYNIGEIDSDSNNEAPDSVIADSVISYSEEDNKNDWGCN